MKNYSLKNRLMIWISIPVFFAVVILLIMSYLYVKHEIEEVYDAQLAHSAKVLLQLVKKEILESDQSHLGLENSEIEHKYERKIGFRIWVDNKIILQSNITESFKNFEAPPGFSDQELNDYSWRYFVFLEPESKIKIEVVERYDIRYELIFQLMFSLLVPLSLFIPILFIIINFGVHAVLKPVILISKEVDHRNTNDLSPIDKKGLPCEIISLITALNKLFGRIQESISREREFTDHAAHELRTPLAAMKTQTQVLMKKIKQDENTIEGFKNLETSINRATRLVEQLLSLARLQNENLPMNKFNLSELIQVICQNHEDMAHKKNIHLSLNVANNIYFFGHAETTSILLNNVLDNAIKYTPTHGAINITFNDDGVLKIADTGPGLSDIDKSKAFERFVRMDKTGQTGSGLGLAIAQWIANSQSIEISLEDNNPKGLIVRLYFPNIEVS